jgi:hypothetical protein
VVSRWALRVDKVLGATGVRLLGRTTDYERVHVTVAGCQRHDSLAAEKRSQKIWYLLYIHPNVDYKYRLNTLALAASIHFRMISNLLFQMPLS